MHRPIFGNQAAQFQPARFKLSIFKPGQSQTELLRTQTPSREQAGHLLQVSGNLCTDLVVFHLREVLSELSRSSGIVGNSTGSLPVPWTVADVSLHLSFRSLPMLHGAVLRIPLFLPILEGEFGDFVVEIRKVLVTHHPSIRAAQVAWAYEILTGKIIPPAKFPPDGKLPERFSVRRSSVERVGSFLMIPVPRTLRRNVLPACTHFPPIQTLRQ